MSEPQSLRETAPTADEVASWLTALALASPAAGDAARIDRIRVLEELKSAAAAAQAREAVAFKTSQLSEQRAAGVPARDLGKGISAQVALARRESPHRAARLMGLAEALVDEMPHTMAALSAGTISEWRATIVVKETACLSRENRALVDKRLADRLGSLSDGQVHAETRKHAYELDPYAALDRAAGGRGPAGDAATGIGRDDVPVRAASARPGRRRLRGPETRNRRPARPR